VRMLFLPLSLSQLNDACVAVRGLVVHAPLFANNNLSNQKGSRLF
jgi:hypothetical protein